MTTIRYRKIRCDECGKEVEMKDETGFSIPHKWFQISITEGKVGSGTVMFESEVCSHKCAIKKLNSIKKLTRPKAYL